jgi:hypothetical protein
MYVTTWYEKIDDVCWELRFISAVQFSAAQKAQKTQADIHVNRTVLFSCTSSAVISLFYKWRSK